MKFKYKFESVKLNRDGTVILSFMNDEIASLPPRYISFCINEEVVEFKFLSELEDWYIIQDEKGG